MTFSLRNEIQKKLSITLSGRMDQEYSPVAEMASTFLRLEALQTVGKVVYRKKSEGAIEEEDREKILSIFEDLKKRFNLVEFSESNESVWNDAVQKLEYTSQTSFKTTFVNDDSYIVFNLNRKDAYFAMEGFNLEEIQEIMNLVTPKFKKKSQRKGRVCALLKGVDGVTVSDLGIAGSGIIEENYAPAVIEDYKFLIKDLASKTPKGRLVILNGKPGGGKSYFVRGLIDAVEHSIFLIVPSSLIGHLSDPSFMPAMLSLQEDEKAPIILVLEDADASLLPRGSDNMSTISDMLNFADGIVGNIIDLRIIATTNAKKMEIEPALLRKGRLSKNISIEALAPEQLKKIFCRITEQAELSPENTPKELNSPMMLSDVYDLALTYKEKKKQEA